MPETTVSLPNPPDAKHLLNATTCRQAGRYHINAALRPHKPLRIVSDQYQLKCGIGENSDAFRSSPVTPWKAWYATRKGASLSADCVYGYTRVDTDAFYCQSIMTIASWKKDEKLLSPRTFLTALATPSCSGYGMDRKYMQIVWTFLFLARATPPSTAIQYLFAEPRSCVCCFG